MTATQTERLLELLRERGAEGVTALYALEVIGSFRLAARIKDLRDAGHAIRSDRVTLPNGKVVARYVLVADEPRWRCSACSTVSRMRVPVGLDDRYAMVPCPDCRRRTIHERVA